MNAQLYSGARCLNNGIKLQQSPYMVCASSKGSVFPACNKYQKTYELADI